MRATRAYLTVAALAAVFSLLAVLLARPLLLFGVASLVGFLVATQYAFYRDLRRTNTDLHIEQTIDRAGGRVEEPFAVTISASMERPSPLALTIQADLPVTATGVEPSETTLDLDRGDRSASTTFHPAIDVAGTAEFGQPTLTATDPLGLVSETLWLGSSRSLTIEPRGPRNVHVGEGGERLAATFGDHPAGRIGPGLSPMELREYVPGDAANRIDWKATARLNHPYVREDEAETDQMTALVVDHREAMATGPPEETKLDYARQVALAILTAARDHDDPLGLYAIGDAGPTVMRSPESTPSGYAAISRDLLDLSVTASSDVRSARHYGPTDARTIYRHLESDQTSFGTTLRPYYENAAAYVHRVESEPLFNVARSALGRLHGTLLTLFLTDDTNPAEVREAVKIARRGDDRVVVFLTPDSLFRPGGLDDLEAAYDRYQAFEEFRRDLTRMERVSAFEVAPGERVEAVLDARRRRAAGGQA